uniref:Uncharacterized protein n=1 Tax=Tanacetum cinerariifolium TaxID=118510 RepID=A0A6L2KLJ6_TANCI|nr:hypothetical protein [Tanacetum cinerariifolium]
MVFHKMDTEEVSDRFVAPSFVNGLEAYDEEINLGVEENMISNEYVVKLCLEYKVKIGNKIVKKELIVALRGEIYFVKFIINPEEDDIEPGVIFERSFLRMTKEITDFGARTITIYPDIDPFLEDIEEEEKLGRKEMKKVDRGIIMINHTQAEAMGILTNVLCQVELCHEFYSTYEFNEVCVDDELQTKKIIKFRLGGRAHNITLLEFAHRLGLYHANELEEDGFDVYFQGGLRSDEHFNAQEYWLSISREENLGLSRSHTSTIRSQNLRVIHKMITYGLCQRTTGYDKIQKNDLWLLSLFDARHQNRYANVAWLIARWMKRKGDGTQRESQIYYG